MQFVWQLRGCSYQVSHKRPAAHLTGHISDTTNNTSSGLRPCAFISSGMVLFTCATILLDLAMQNPMDWLILPHWLKPLDIFSAGHQYIEIHKYHLNPNYFLFEQQEKNRVNNFLHSSLHVCLLFISCQLDPWWGPLAGSLVLVVLHRDTPLVLRDRHDGEFLVFCLLCLWKLKCPGSDIVKIRLGKGNIKVENLLLSISNS